MDAPVLELRDVWLHFRGTPILEGIDLTLERNDYLAILGPNGSGKTTLLKVILGILEPDRGTVRIFGQPPKKCHGRIGYVPQHVRFDLGFPITALEVTMMGRLAQRRGVGGYGRTDQEAARRMLERVEMDRYADRQIGTLSGGQLQRVLIARALALEPELMLLDEPTASLDERIEHSIWELLEELSHEMTVVLVSHDVGAISAYVRSVACLNRKLYYHPSKELTREILEATYGCGIDLLAHGQPHRVLPDHDEGERR